MDADAILNQAIRPELGGGTGAGGGAEFGVARFGEGLETIQGVEVKVGDPQFTLIWDSEADIDLHVLEPGGAHIYWSNRQGAKGGELDVDDTNGFGPENVYWLEADAPTTGRRSRGRGPRASTTGTSSTTAPAASTGTPRRPAGRSGSSTTTRSSSTRASSAGSRSGARSTA